MSYIEILMFVSDQFQYEDKEKYTFDHSLFKY